MLELYKNLGVAATPGRAASASLKGAAASAGVPATATAADPEAATMNEPAPSHLGYPNAATKVTSASVWQVAEGVRDDRKDEGLMALRREVRSLTADMSVAQLMVLSDPIVRAAGLLMADLLKLRQKDAAGLTMLVAGLETLEAGRHGEMAVALYREALAIRSDAKRKAFEKKRTSRIKSLSDFGRDVLLDEVARLRGLRE